MRAAQRFTVYATFSICAFMSCLHSAWGQCTNDRIIPESKIEPRDCSATQFSFGQNTEATGKQKKYLAASTRGNLSSGGWLHEYDLGYIAIDANAPAPANTLPVVRSAASYRLAAVSMALINGARIYTGTFPAAAGDTGQSVGNFFFAHPAIVGVAYKSSGTALSDYGMSGAVRLVLSTQSQVRISSSGRELFNGVLGAGDQMVEFAGYQDAFVDVFIRDASGVTQTLVAEVIRSAGSATAPAAGSGFWGDIYLDAGRMVATGKGGAGFHLADTGQVGVSYVHSAWDYLVLAGYQAVGDRRRFAVSVSPIDRSWQMNFMRGNEMEAGYNFSGSLLRWGKLDISLNQTLYRTPLSTVITNGKPSYYLNDKLCLANLTPICHRPASFDSLGLTFGYEGFPFHMGYIETRTSDARLSAVTVSGLYHFALLGFPLSASAFVATDLRKRNHSVYVALSIPLGEYASLATGLASNGEKYRTATTSYTRHADETAADDIRALDLTAAASRSPALEYSSASAHMESRMGMLKNISSLAASSRGTQSFDSSFSMASTPTQNQPSTSP